MKGRFFMKLKRIISSAAAVALVMSSLSFSVSANLNAKPFEPGFETGQERNDSDMFDFMDKPYSLTSGDYYMGMGIQLGSWTHRNAIGSPDVTNVRLANVNGQIVEGINNYCPWSHLYSGGYALINKDANGVAFRSSHAAYGPTGLYYSDGEGDSGIKEYAVLHDAKIGGSGTYTVGIEKYNFKADCANAKGTNDGDPGNGINLLYISSNIQHLKNNGVTISNPVLKLYNTKEEYEAKTPYKSIPAGYWITGKGDNETGYAQYTFTNIWAVNGENDKENGGKFNFDSKYQDAKGNLDVFGVSSYTGAASSEYKSGYAGCSFLPEYAMEITFNANVPDSMMNSVISKPLQNVLGEVSNIINSADELAKVQAKNPTLTVDQIKEKLTAAYNSANGVLSQYGNYKSLSKSLLAEPQAAIDKALNELKAVCSDLGILIWGELMGYVETVDEMDFTKYTADSWAAVESAVEEARALKERYDNGEAITQEQIDAITVKLRAAIDNLKEAAEKVDSTTGLGYVEFKDIDGKYQWYNDGKNYKNVTAKTVDVVTSEKGDGKTYTVKATCDGTAKGLADCNLEIQGLIDKQSKATVTVDEVKLDGKKQKLTGVPYTQVVDEKNAYVPLYDAEVTEIPEDAYTSPDGKCAKDASPQALSKGAKNDYAAIDTEWEELTVKFTVNWSDTTEEASENENNSENPDTAGGAAVAASLIVLLGAGYVVSRKRTK